MFQGDPGPRFGGTVAGDEVCHGVRGERARHKRGGVRDHAVEYYGIAVCGSGQDHAYQGRVLETANLRQDPERVFRIRSVQLQCLLLPR